MLNEALSEPWGTMRWKVMSEFFMNPTRKAHGRITIQKRISGPRTVAGSARGRDFSCWKAHLASVFCCFLSGTLLICSSAASGWSDNKWRDPWKMFQPAVSLSASSFFLPSLCWLVQGVQWWDKEALQSRTEGSWTASKLVNLSDRKWMGAPENRRHWWMHMVSVFLLLQLSVCLSVDAEESKLLSSSRLRLARSDATQLIRATLLPLLSVSEQSCKAKLSRDCLESSSIRPKFCCATFTYCIEALNVIKIVVIILANSILANLWSMAGWRGVEWITFGNSYMHSKSNNLK